MANEEQTQPNPNTPRTFLRRAWTWCMAHREYSVPIAAFVVGAIIGKLL